MKKKCPNCRPAVFTAASVCPGCGGGPIEISSERRAIKSSRKARFLRRALVCAAVCLLSIFGFYLSLLFTSKPLSYDERAKVRSAVRLLEEKGFSSEVFLLNYVTSFRGNDNWLNASTREESAYAATNYPFEIMTVYPDFFQYPTDDVERAAVLLHEAQHLKGADEREAYEFVWRNRHRLGWTKDKYESSIVWRNVRRQTREICPQLFVCDFNDFDDCTEL